MKKIDRLKAYKEKQKNIRKNVLALNLINNGKKNTIKLKNTRKKDIINNKKNQTK